MKKSYSTKQFEVVGLVMMIAGIGLVAARILLGLLPIDNEIVSDTVFTLIVQVGILLIMPFCIYKFVLGKSVRGVLEFSNFKKTRVVNLLLAVGIGICGFVVTIAVSTMWTAFLMGFGYVPNYPPDSLPAEFNAGLFALSMFSTAVLPSICEEFIMRGGFLTTIRKSFSFQATVVIMAVAFGLFHAYVPQFFYTMLFGGLLGFIVLKTRSIFPAMIIHFMNNGINVYLESAEKYGWVGGDMFNWIQATAVQSPQMLMLAFFVFAAALAFLVFLINQCNRSKYGAIAENYVEEMNDVDICVGRYRPTLRESAFYMGAITVTALATIFSFIWGAM